jgi:hypothetical protein
VERNHVDAFKRIDEYLKSHSLASLKPEQLLPVIQRALVLTQRRSAALKFGGNTATGYDNSVDLLLTLPAAQQLPADAIAALVNVAVKALDSLHVWQLLQLPAAMSISPAQLASIVELAAAAQYDTILEELSWMPAFNHLEPARAAAAIVAASQTGCTSSLALLLNSSLQQALTCLCQG